MFLALSLAACSGGGSGGGAGSGSSVGGASTGTSSISGTVNGGLPGIANATMDLYMANPSGSPTLLGNAISGTNGNYTIKYDPPTSNSQLLYVVATGSSGNPNLNLMSFVGLSGGTLPTSIVVNELTTVSVAYEAIQNHLTLNGTSLSGSSTQIVSFNNAITNLVNSLTGTISNSTNVPPADRQAIFELANGLENCVNNTSVCSGPTPPNLSNIEAATSNYINNTITGPTVSSIGSTSGTFGTSENNTTNATTLTGTLITANVNSSNQFTLETFPFTATGSIPSPTPATSLPIATGQIPAGGGFDSTYNVYVVSTINAANSSETVTLYNYTPASGFGSAINSMTLTASSGNTCSGGGGLNPTVHAAFASCSGSSNPQICLYFYNASGLQSCVQPSIPSSISTQSLRGENLLDLLWVRSETSTSTTTTYSYTGVFKPTYTASSVSLGTENTFGPITFTVNSTNPTTFGYDDTEGLIFVSAYCNSGSCSSEPLDVLTFNTSTGVINSAVNASQSLPGTGNLLNSSHSSNSGDYSSIDQTDKIFFLESFSSGIVFTPYTYDATGTVTPLTPLSITSISSPNGNTGAMIDPNSHIVFVPEGSSSTANGIEAVPYNNTGALTPDSSTITPASGLTAPNCTSSSCNNIPNFLFDAVN